MVDPAYKVHVVPSVPSEHHVVRYKALRLQALQIDPECFSSTYDRESSMSNEEWRARLHSGDKVTIAAVTGASIQSLSESEMLYPENEWVGTVTVLGPKFLLTHAFSPPKGVQWVEENVKYYLFVGVWVHPSHRGKGLGKRLVSAGMDWVRADEAGHNSTDKQILLLQIMPGNKSAIKLYRSIGFHPIESDKGATNTDIWMGMELA
ncbi:hypothetical protein Agabi119p4_7606 [Agaricus bisporus var. burnettii]|uniref:N-acetyltransferase domain-containing protein n=1 Tax=Agaricus bisporus var. burnettii TaxID=192524 RepID=A0A8H7EZ34_AGABI|nr:hypothetical protein Agabi119p4_7606 [Agaricus bisporus var. burnettii]